MLTPRFSLSQDADFVFIHIMAPYIKLEESDCYVYENEFYFYSQPYYLRLHLPGNILENELSTSKYEVDSGQLTVRVAKETKGEVFEGLDMLTKLLTHKKVTSANAEIEVVSSTNEQSGNNVVVDEDTEEEPEFDWFLEQNVNETHCPSLISGPSYGFAQRKSNGLNELVAGFPELLDLKDPDNVPVNQRRSMREQQEKEQFSCEHYLADLFDDEIIQEFISPTFHELTGTAGTETVFTELEREKLLQLPRREYVIDDSELKAVYLGLVDLVFAYAYNFRFTKGEHNVESEWTICKLSATLLWLDSFENMNEVIVSCARRSLCFPLYRSWDLFNRVLGDVKTIFLTGKSQVLKCLLGIHKVLAASDSRYAFNELYITDYCVWLQSADPKRIESIAKALGEVKISKSDLNLSLDEMESDARKLMNECADDKNCKDDGEKYEDIERLTNALSDIVIFKDATAVDSDDNDDSDEEDDSEDDDSDEDDNDSTDTSDENDDPDGIKDKVRVKTPVPDDSDEEDDSEDEDSSDSDESTDTIDKNDDHDNINDKVKDKTPVPDDN